MLSHCLSVLLYLLGSRGRTKLKSSYYLTYFTFEELDLFSYFLVRAFDLRASGLRAITLENYGALVLDHCRLLGATCGGIAQPLLAQKHGG